MQGAPCSNLPVPHPPDLKRRNFEIPPSLFGHEEVYENSLGVYVGGVPHSACEAIYGRVCTNFGPPADMFKVSKRAKLRLWFFAVKPFKADVAELFF